jgi:ribokinase
MAHMVVVGSSTTDLVVNVPRLPVPGETVIGTGSQIFSGGKGANQAAAASRCGSDVYFVGRIGSDHFGDMQVESLKEAGVNVDFLHRDSETPSAIGMINLMETGENAIVVAPGSNHTLTPRDIDSAMDIIASAGLVLLQLEIPIQTTLHVIEKCSETGCRIILNPAPADSLPMEILRKVDILTPNEIEMAALAGIRTDSRTDLAKAGKYLVDLGINNVIITLGKSGIIWCSRDSAKHYPAFSVDPVDTTGAGDTFNGALAHGLLKNYSRDDTCRFAMAAAAISTTRYGAQPSIPTKREIDIFLEKH